MFTQFNSLLIYFTTEKKNTHFLITTFLRQICLFTNPFFKFLDVTRLVQKTHVWSKFVHGFTVRFEVKIIIIIPTNIIIYFILIYL